MVAFPERLAVTIPATKFPDASLFTIVDAVLELVEELARTTPAATLEDVWPPTRLTTVAVWVPVTSPRRFPEKEIAVFAEPEEVEVVAFPLKLAVIVPAAKSPLVSLLTIAPEEFELEAALVATVADATELADWPPTELTTVRD